MALKVLVLGASSQLGQSVKYLRDQYAYEFLFADRSQYVSADASGGTLNPSLFDSYLPALVLNCVAYTAVDAAETHVNEAYRINRDFVSQVCRKAKSVGASVVHFSTDFVFDGSLCRPYVETDITNPLSVYGKSKRAGELEFEASGVSGAVIRTSWLYSPFGKNFPKTIRKLAAERPQLKVVSEQFGSPTSAIDLSRFVLDHLGALQAADAELFHYSNEGQISWYDFAKEILKTWHIEAEVKPILAAEYPTPAQRPLYSVLSKDKVRDRFGIQVPSWDASLREVAKIEKSLSHLQSSFF